jgi:hypothetical protein
MNILQYYFRMKESSHVYVGISGYMFAWVKRRSFASISYHSVGCLFTLLIISFAEVFQFDIILLALLAFVTCAFVVLYLKF